jgi:hypothetical protein
VSRDIASSLLNNDSSWFSNLASTVTNGFKNFVQSGINVAKNFVKGLYNPKLPEIKKTLEPVVSSNVFDQRNMVSLAQVDPNSKPLRLNAEAAKETDAIKYRCVENTARILDKSGTTNLPANTMANHTMETVKVLAEKGWKPVMDADPWTAPPGSFVASFDSSRVSVNSPYGSDAAIVSMSATGDKYLGGKPGTEGAYKVDKNNPHASVYGNRGKSFVMVPPGSFTV